MHKRIFLKYYSACAAIILITVILLGGISSVVMSLRSTEQQSDNMERAATTVAGTISRLSSNYWVVYSNILNDTILTIKEVLKSDIVVLDSTGNATLFSTSSSYVEKLITQQAYDQVMEGNVYKKSTAFLDEGHRKFGYTVGVPIVLNDNVISGAVFITTTEVNVYKLIPGTLATFFFCGILVLMIAFVAVFFITKRLTRPLNEFAQAASEYAKGDFSRRIAVNSNDELASLAITFNNMADGIDRLESMRRGFVADVSHELRTPMTTISGFIDGMLDGTIPPEMQKKYLQIVSDEVKRLSRLVSSLLDVAKIQAGQMTYVMHNFDILETAGKNAFTFKDRVDQKNITLTVDMPQEPVYVKGDEDAIYRVIYNLMDNALKFTPDDGEITLGVAKKDDKAVVYVKNTGQGVSKKDAGHIFERFYKTDKSRGENKKGVGIGLYLVKSIVNAHGEDIYLTSKEGEFAQFAFTLTLADKD